MCVGVACLRDEIAAGVVEVNIRQRRVNRCLKADDARSKLKSVYPKIKV